LEADFKREQDLERAKRAAARAAEAKKREEEFAKKN
jgi:hypothetical protein